MLVREIVNGKTSSRCDVLQLSVIEQRPEAAEAFDIASFLRVVQANHDTSADL